MLVAMNSSQNYKLIIEMCVYDNDRYECMMRHCDDCPDPSELKRFLKNELLITIDQDGTIKYTQWVSTDRSRTLWRNLKI